MKKGDKKPDTKELQQQVGELTEALQRERADAVNQRRHHDQQYARLQTSVKAEVIKELLPAIDNLERALKHTPKNMEGNDYVKGVQGVVKQFEKILSDLGVQKVKAVGETFDPNIHEAVGVEDDGVAEGDHVVEVVCEELQPGYCLFEEVIRPAMVKVKKQKSNKQKSKQESKESKNKEE